MFFGAGNLIFPPFLGSQAGTGTWTAMIGFALSAICLPILGVIAVAQSGGLPALAGRVHPKFAYIFTLLIYLSIGPCLAIPRTASTSFEMAVIPFMANIPAMVRIGYSLIFFAVALFLALHPEKLSDRLGKILGPCLLTLIFIIVVGCLFNSPGGYGVPTGSYTNNRIVQGFLDGYLTMDTIAALNFGIIISLNIKNKGVENEGSVVKYTIMAGWIAGAVLLAVYAALAHIGAVSGGSFSGASNGAGVLTNLVSYLFGRAGIIILGLIFVIACLNTCIGLLCCCSEYFSTIFPKISYRAWVLIFALASFLISIAGLNAILAVSVPVLNAIYPVAIVLIILGLFNRFFSKFRYVYPVTITFTGVVSIVYALNSAKITIPVITGLITRIPPLVDLCWVLPAVCGMIIGIAASVLSGNHKSSTE
ncbi:branched-chain amino acid transport system II carrier protein [Lachnospiraceae bacterium NSJ-143]|nr:branched-chain amino acid transport system II carrier protein [Lachnospiraceae bacterium NSJ-143]